MTQPAITHRVQLPAGAHPCGAHPCQAGTGTLHAASSQTASATLCGRPVSSGAATEAAHLAAPTCKTCQNRVLAG